MFPRWCFYIILHGRKAPSPLETGSLLVRNASFLSGWWDKEARAKKKQQKSDTWGDFWTRISKVYITPRIFFSCLHAALHLPSAGHNCTANESPVCQIIQTEAIASLSFVAESIPVFLFFWANFQTDVFWSPLWVRLLGEKISAHFQWAGAKFPSLASALGWWY